MHKSHAEQLQDLHTTLSGTWCIQKHIAEYESKLLNATCQEKAALMKQHTEQKQTCNSHNQMVETLKKTHNDSLERARQEYVLQSAKIAEIISDAKKEKQALKEFLENDKKELAAGMQKAHKQHI